MKKINKKLIVIKYGSNTLVTKNMRGNFSIDFNNINEQGFIIDKHNGPVIIVSSGAVAFGRIIGEFDYIKDDTVRKRVLASAGNPHLSINWDKAIPRKTILQGLITHRDLINKDSRESLKDIIYNVYQKPGRAVIQINDNDFVSDEELKIMRHGNFGDNDQVTALLAELCAEIFSQIEIIINTSSDGVIKRDKTVSKLTVDRLGDRQIEILCGAVKTDLGTGGMADKLKIIRDLINKSPKICAHIINGKKPEHLAAILEGKSAGTEICRK